MLLCSALVRASLTGRFLAPLAGELTAVGRREGGRPLVLFFVSTGWGIQSYQTRFLRGTTVFAVRAAQQAYRGPVGGALWAMPSWAGSWRECWAPSKDAGTWAGLSPRNPGLARVKSTEIALVGWRSGGIRIWRRRIAIQNLHSSGARNTSGGRAIPETRCFDCAGHPSRRQGWRHIPVSQLSLFLSV